MEDQKAHCQVGREFPTSLHTYIYRVKGMKYKIQKKTEIH